jgi:hypothetical protein
MHKFDNLLRQYKILHDIHMKFNKNSNMRMVPFVFLYFEFYSPIYLATSNLFQHYSRKQKYLLVKLFLHLTKESTCFYYLRTKLLLQ